MSQTNENYSYETAVDDVRRVRERLHEQFGGDIRKLAEHANATAEKYREELGLKLVQPPPRDKRRDGTGG